MISTPSSPRSLRFVCCPGLGPCLHWPALSLDVLQFVVANPR